MEKAYAAESLAVLATERDVDTLDRTKVHTNQSAPEPFRPTTNNTTSINDEESEATSKFGMKLLPRIKSYQRSKSAVL